MRGGKGRERINHLPSKGGKSKLQAVGAAAMRPRMRRRARRYLRTMMRRVRRCSSGERVRVRVGTGDHMAVQRRGGQRDRTSQCRIGGRRVCRCFRGECPWQGVFGELPFGRGSHSSPLPSDERAWVLRHSYQIVTGINSIAFNKCTST